MTGALPGRGVTVRVVENAVLTIAAFLIGKDLFTGEAALLIWHRPRSI